MKGALSYHCSSDIFFFFSPPGCRLSRISEHSSLHVSELRRPCHVWPLCCSGAFWVQLSRRPLLLLCKGQTARTFFLRDLLKTRSILVTCSNLKWFCILLYSHFVYFLNYKYISMTFNNPPQWLFAVFQIYIFLFSSKASNGQWYQMNDSMVHSSNIKVVLNQQAYVLFYLR